LFINYYCTPGLSSSWTAHQHTQRAAHGTGCGPTVQISSKKPVTSKFVEYKPSGLSRVVCNVVGFLQA